MHTQAEGWSSPLLPKDFDWKAEGAQLEASMISPAVGRIVGNIVSSRLSELNPLNGGADSLKLSRPKEGWDSVMRFNDKMERVMPFRVASSGEGIGAEPNPDFEQPGLIVFARNSPAGTYSVNEKRNISSTNLGQRVLVTLLVKIPDESVFETQWFRLA